MKIDFSKETFTLSEQQLIKKEVEVIKSKYPNHIPVVVNSKDKTIKLTKNKFLIGEDITIGQFMFILKKRISGSKNPSVAMYLFIDDKIFPASQMLSYIYNQHKDKSTGMLFVKVCQENTFG